MGDTGDLNQTNANDVAEQGRRDLESGALWQETERNFQAGGRAADVQRALTEAVERAAVDAFQAALAPVLRGPAVMLAAGGFARRELFPYSNADIVIVREGEPPRELNDAVAGFVGLLWARGVRPNQRVCGIAECLALVDQGNDLGLRLIDRRMLAGDFAVAEKLERELAGLIERRGRQIVERIVSETRARHAKWQDTPSHREPDVEETPGGLRDLRLLADLQKLRPDRMQSTQRLDEAAAFFSSVRCFLHYRARENRNLLDLAAQEAIAGAREPSLWMREYFRHARAVFQRSAPRPGFLRRRHATGFRDRVLDRPGSGVSPARIRGARRSSPGACNGATPAGRPARGDRLLRAGTAAVAGHKDHPLPAPRANRVARSPADRPAGVGLSRVGPHRRRGGP